MLPVLPGYQLNEKIYESTKTVVYRGYRSRDQHPVAIKFLKGQYPTSRELAIFRKQFTLSERLNLPGVVRSYCIENYGTALALVLEDFGAVSLKQYYEHHAPSLSEFLAIAIQVAQILAQLHQHNIIHKDIKPANLLINSETKQVKITDFSIATVLQAETQSLINPARLEGTLAYLSPEQTGRMNREIDYRTDFYSLGVTFYQLLTQRLPFESHDPLELVYCHLARQPISPTELNFDVPEMLSAIVLKLMAKTAEDRYQSAIGLKHDLERCQQQYEQDGKIEAFVLAQQDLCDRFQIPAKLYGRNREVKTLLEAFDRVAVPQRASGEFLLVTGYSGIGKSSLVQEVYKPIVQRRGYFISGKFDQLQRNIPYSAIVVAFQSLMRQLLSEPETELQRWREQLLAALGTQAQVIIDVIPELEWIIDAQPAVAVLPPTEAQNRFDRLFQNFIRVFCQPAHPFVIFLDDLQWADSATLRLIKLMLTNEQTQHFFLIGAYRDNEVDAAHPLMMLCTELQSANVNLQSIVLTPLNTEQVAELISDTMQCSIDAVQSLTELVMQKTEGNPFFINELLKTLHQEKLLSFDVDRRSWHWEIEQIQAIDFTDNIVELLIRKLKKLPNDTQQVLQLAACIGNQFDLKTLALIHPSSEVELTQLLSHAVDFGMIAPTSASEIDPATTHLTYLNYRFLHDRIQQAAYALISNPQKQSVHLQIGRLLYEKSPVERRNDLIFELTEHFNIGQALITAPQERLELANLNLQAGYKAKQATAYSAAQQYFTSARTILGDAWSEQYELMLSLHREQAEVEYLLGNFEAAQDLIDRSLIHVKSALEQAELYKLLIVVYTLKTQYQAAIVAGQKALDLLDIAFPETDLEAVLEVELTQAKLLLSGRKISEILNGKEMSVPEQKTAAKLLVALGAPTYFSNHVLWMIVVMKLVNLSLKYGQLPESTYGYSEYGLILGAMLGEYQSGYEFGQLSLNLAERFKDQAEKCKVCVVIGGSVNHWVRPLKEDAVIFMKGYQAGLESGELQFAGYNIAHQMVNCFYQGIDLESLSLKLPDYHKFVQQTQNQLAQEMLSACQLTIQTLQGNLSALKESQFLEDCRSHSSFSAICFYQIFKAQVLYLFDHPSEALDCIQAAKPLLQYIPGCISLAAFNFYHSLILSALYPKADSSTQKQLWQELSNNQQQMKVWAEHCPENFLHQYQLIEAEIARLSGDRSSAITLYDQALAQATLSEFTPNIALINEQAAKFWIADGKEKIAQAFLLEAYYLYRAWGATEKLVQLERNYPQLSKFIYTTDATPTEQTFSASHLSSSSTDTSQLLDLATILKASEVISQAIQLDKLLETLIRVVMENAGAQIGVILLRDEDRFADQEQTRWRVVAQGISDRSGITLIRSLPILLEEAVPVPLIHYVARTQEKQLIHDATNDATFATDAYILKHRPKSILCFPVQYQNQLIGIFYLEHRQLTHAFTRDRWKVLSLLSTQMAIAISNATLYQNLQIAEARERDRASQLEQSLIQLQQTQTQLIQTEKISSLGQLVAGVAHEVNNPVGFISGNLKYATQYVDELIGLVRKYQEIYPNSHAEIAELIDQMDLEFVAEDLPKMIDSMKLGIERIRDIMHSLRSYSRSDSTEKQPADLHKGLDSTLMILSHRLKASSDRPAIQIIKQYEPLPEVRCFAAQLNQVFMNLLANAIDALEDSSQGKQYAEIEKAPNTITIATHIEENNAIIRISDNGAGMSPEVQQHLFEAFFTTKPEGKGTGLGLSICYQIVVEKHGGSLTFNSQPDKGTEFKISIPIAFI
ncbi:AAA family ATPase [Cyanobacteria bacterium FACHB-DQ100]|nr:AAA family ATPase [Cyanobacteria bacterium FACHB-DQ100]